MVAVGLIKGNGSGLLKPLTRLVCGSWEPARSELLALSATSRECFLAAILLVADQVCAPLLANISAFNPTLTSTL